MNAYHVLATKIKVTNSVQAIILWYGLKKHFFSISKIECFLLWQIGNT